MISEKQLDPKQREAVQTKDGSLLVIAPGGSGKTDVLIHRLIDFLSDKSNEGRKAVCLTFTRGAADELLSRIRGSGEEFKTIVKHQRNLDISTLHSLCRILLDRHSYKEDPDRYKAYGSRYTLLKETHKRELIAKAFYNVLSEQNKKRNPKHGRGLNKRLIPHPLMCFCSKKKGELQKVERLYYTAADRLYHTQLQKEHGMEGELLLYGDYLPMAVPDIKKDHQELLCKVVKEITRLKNVNDGAGSYYKADYDDMLCLVWSLLKSGEIEPQYDFVQVDEVQDISPLQLDIIRGLTKKDASVAYFGDKNQAIFSFMGGCPENVDKLRDEEKEENVIYFNVNHRSTARLLNFQYHVLKKFLYRDEDGSAKPICPELKSGGSSKGDDYVKIKGLKTQESQKAYVVREASSMLKEENRVSEVAILCRMNEECRSFDKAFRKKGIVPYLFSDETFSTMKETAGLFLSMDSDFNHSFSEVKSISDELRKRVKEKEKGTGAGGPLVDLLIRYVECQERLYDNLIPEKVTWDEFYETIKESKIEDVYVMRDKDGNKLIRNAVIISTVHKSKGKSFEAVIVPSVVEGIYPFKKSSGMESVEEGARVFYVAVSRAERKLLITYYEKGNVWELRTDKFKASGGKHRRAKVSVRKNIKHIKKDSLKPSRFISYRRGTEIENL